MSTTWKPKRLFDLEKANETLPLVSRILEDIVRVNGKIWDLHRQAKELLGEGRRERAEELQDEMQSLDFERADYIVELEAIGCELKDPEIGLVDFPARLDDRIVLLCWRLGEPEITHWHEVHAGVRGRQSTQGLVFTC